jgi:hypothetical protein
MNIAALLSLLRFLIWSDFEVERVSGQLYWGWGVGMFRCHYFHGVGIIQRNLLQCGILD